MTPYLEPLSAVLMIVGFVPYIWGILFGASRPVRATWILWASLDVLMCIGMYKTDSLNAQIIGATVGSVTTMFLSLRYGKPGWTKFEVGCLIAGINGIVLWIITSDPTIAVLIVGTVMFVAAIPTFQSAWENPWYENRWSWLLAFLSCVVFIPLLPPVNQWWEQITKVLQPLVFIIVETIVMYLVWIRPLWLPEIRPPTEEQL
jgi:hypothetical protein